MNKLLTLIICFLVFSCTTNEKQEDYLNLSSKLSGKWKAIAFDGELHEKWTLTESGEMLQEGHYIENSDTSYSAQTKIEKVANEIILFSVIKNSNPKILN